MESNSDEILRDADKVDVAFLGELRRTHGKVLVGPYDWLAQYV